MLSYPIERAARATRSMLVSPAQNTGDEIELSRAAQDSMPEVPERGQQLFLSCTEVLQNVLLPLLSAVDLGRLCVSCRGLRLWLLSLPPGYWKVHPLMPLPAAECFSLSLADSQSSLTLMVCWQDAPSDAAPGYLASLPSTDMLLSAVRRGHRARQNILTNAPPIRTEQLQQLPDQCSQPVVQDFRCTGVSCTEVAFSTCGTAMACVIQGHQTCTRKDTNKALLPDALLTSQVVLYQISGAPKPVASYSLGTSTPMIRWCPDQPLLCIAQLPRRRRLCSLPEGYFAWDCVHVPSLHPPAFMVNGDGSLRHALGGKAANVLLEEDTHQLQQHISWSPDAHALLVCRQRAGALSRTEERPAGRLSIISLVEDSFLATSALSEVTSSAAYAAATWLPDSDGILMSCGCSLGDLASFQTAGFAVGVLPEAWHVHHAAFSADGQLLIAHRYYVNFQRTENCFGVISCSRQGPNIFMELMHTFCMHSMCWIPGLLSVLVQPREGYQCHIRHLHADCGYVIGLKQCPSLFSPRARFAVDGLGLASETCSGIMDLHTHEQVWWPGLDRLRVDAQISTLSNFHAHAALCWLPCGSGLVCSSAIRTNHSFSLEKSEKEPVHRRLPLLYFVHFA